MPSPELGKKEDKTTFIGLDAESSICTTRHPANVMTGVVLRLIQEHFANAENMEYNGFNEFRDLDGMEAKQQLQDYIWDKDNTKTKIQIQPVWKYNTQDVQRRPGIYIKRNAQRPQRIAGDDGGWTQASVKNEDGTVRNVPGQYYTQMVIGSHTAFAVGQSGAEAELIGQEVFNHVMMFGPIIRRDMSLHRLQMQELGEVSVLAEFDDHFVVPVVIAYAYAWAWRVDQVAPWLKTLAVDVRVIQ